MVQVNTPFLRWKDRFHRSPFVRDSKFRIFLLRPTFDKLRRVSKENDEGKNTPATEVEILKFIKQVITSTSTNQKSFISKGFLSEKEETEITAAYIENPSNQGGIVVLFPDARKFLINPAYKFLKQYYFDNNLSALITTGPPHSMHLVGMKLKKDLGITWIADFRDPWSNFFQNKLLNQLKSTIKKHEQAENEVL